jgi:hypothetical protein
VRSFLQSSDEDSLSDRSKSIKPYLLNQVPNK